MFDWIGAGIGLLGGLFGGGKKQQTNPNLERIMQEISRAYGEQDRVYQLYGTPEALAASDAKLLSGFDALYEQDSNLQRNQFLSQTAEGYAPGMSDSEWALAQASISSNLARNKSETRLGLDQSRLGRSEAARPDAGLWSSLTGAGAEMDRTKNSNTGLDFGAFLGTLGQLGIGDLFKRGGSSNSGSSSGNGRLGTGGYMNYQGPQGIDGYIPEWDTGSGMPANPHNAQGPIGAAMGGLSGGRQPGGQGRGTGGGSQESVNDRYKLPEYGAPLPMNEAIADRFMNGDASMGGIHNDLLQGLYNRTKPSRRY